MESHVLIIALNKMELMVVVLDVCAAYRSAR